VTKRNRLQQLEETPTVPEAEAAPLAALPPADPEPRQLARELYQAFLHEVERYHRTRAKDPDQDDPRQQPSDWRVENAKDKPDQDVTFFDLERLSRVDPALMHERWDRVTATASEDLATGYLAALALEHLGGTAWERACFLAVRRRLHGAWRPRHDGEVALLDEMAQYEVLRLKWVGVLSMLTQEPATVNALGRKFTSDDGSRHISKAQATLEALRLVECLQRLYQNSLRALLSIRRGKTAVFVRRAGQVNLAGGPQFNAQCMQQRSARTGD